MAGKKGTFGTEKSSELGITLCGHSWGGGDVPYFPRHNHYYCYPWGVAWLGGRFSDAGHILLLDFDADYMGVFILWKWFMCFSACVEHFNKKLKECLVSDIKGENTVMVLITVATTKSLPSCSHHNLCTPPLLHFPHCVLIICYTTVTTIRPWASPE